MSAFLCNPKHIGTLAVFATTNDPHNKVTAVDAADIWARANVRSVAARYADLDEDRAAQEFLGIDSAAEYVLACRNATFHAREIAPVEAIKMAHCLNYQSCEYAGWLDSEAKRLLDWAEAVAIQALPGYDEAPWEYCA